MKDGSQEDKGLLNQLNCSEIDLEMFFEAEMPGQI